MAGLETEIGALGLIIILGVLGRLFFRKTGVSDVLVLLLVGVAAGPLLPASSVAGLDSLLLPLGAFALLVIILDEGLHLSFAELRRQAHKALLFGLASFSFAFLVSFALCFLVFHLDVLLCLLIASIFASVAPELLSGFLSAMGAPDSVRGLAEIEAALSDALSVMLTLLLVSSYSQGSSALSFGSLPAEIALILFLSAALGGFFAALWKAVILKIAEGNEHLAAIGLAALLYAVSGMLGANGVISIFIFGFFLGNTSHKSVEEVRRFHSEVSFFLRTFFFVYLGVLLFHSPKPVEIALLAAILSLLLAAARAAPARLAAFLEPSARKGRLLESVSGRGLTAAVLSVVAYGQLTHAGYSFELNLPLLALFVIFFTNAISAFIVFRRHGRLAAPQEEESGGKHGLLGS